MPDDVVSPGVYKATYARAPFIFGMARARALPGPVLVALMTVLEGTPAANKALLHRMVEGGSLTLTRVGRVGVYGMAGRLLTGFTAIRGDGSLRSSGWDGRFHALVYDIPESRRRDRDRFLMAAFQVGYRSMRPGVLISPTDESHHLPATDLGLQSAWMTFPEDETPALVERVWRLDAFRAEYEEAIGEVERCLTRPLEKLEGPDALRLLFEAVSPHTALLLRDGALPLELRPEGWPAGRLLAVVEEAERRLAPAASAYVNEQVSGSPYADLVEADEYRPPNL